MRGGTIAAVAALLLAADNVAVAGGFSLTPVGLTIASRDPSSSIVARNTGDAPVVIQARPMAWTQRDGRDVREDTRDLIVNPPIFKLAPGEQQLVRVASRHGPPREAESAYRLIFSEVPPKDGVASQPGFRLALAMDIPVYLEPVAARAPAPLRWRAERIAEGLRLRAENPGNVHYRIVQARFHAADTTLREQGILVVLPNSRLEFDVPAPPVAVTAIHLSAEDGARLPVSVDIPIPPAP